MKKRSYMVRLLLLAVLSASALVSLPRAGAQTGREQTPIDIRNEDLTFDPNLPALGFSYSTKAALSVVNTGSPGEFNTVRAELPGESNNQLTVAGVNYKLLQFHWHTPSEHELNGQKFPLEMHLVHKFDDGSPAGVLSVVGVFVRAGRENAELAKIFSRLPAEKDERRTVARKGYRALLLDKATFPSDTISTHHIHQPGVARLRRWGLLEKVRASNVHATTDIIFDVGPFALRGTPTPTADGTAEAYAPRRKVLDKILVDAAVAAGAELREGFSVEELTTDGDKVTGLRGRDRNGAAVQERARIVVGAQVRGVTETAERAGLDGRALHPAAASPAFDNFGRHSPRGRRVELIQRARRRLGPGGAGSLP